MRVLFIVLGLLFSSLTWGKPLYEDNSAFAEACTNLNDKNTSIKPLVDFTFCHGYISGVTHTLQAMKGIYSEINYCPANKVTDGQVMKVVAKYIENNPQNLHIPLIVNVFNALGDAFPCESTGQ